MYDVVVIGAGPVGLACAIAAQRQGLNTLTIDKGTLVNSLVGYPTNMEFFSTPDLLEIGDHPFPTQRYKPIREEALDYYRRVARTEQLALRLYERVRDVSGHDGAFTIATDKDVYTTRKVVVAIGFFDTPNRLNIPGEDLPKVSHYYKEPYAYTGRELAVIGAKNSAAKAALAAYRHGARVSLIIRGPELSTSIKYWLRPDLSNRIEEGSITAYFNTTVSKITPTELHLQTPDGPKAIPNDFTLAMTGYRPDYPFLQHIGIALEEDEALTPVYNENTFETNRPGLYLAGTVCGGLRTSRWFIENGRFHAQVIAQHIAQQDVATEPIMR
ncbi:MAG: YpdA family putative bacillithiol disulfide reductase [Rhodothermales bacterium]